MSDSLSVNQTSNPHYQPVIDDVSNRTKWESRDQQILKRRLCERPVKKSKPYPGAPNFVVPIVDDVVREKTDQELTMMSNSRLLAYFIPLQDIPPEMLSQAEIGFDTYLRHLLRVFPDVEEALDTKNARGFSIVKIVRTDIPRWGEMPGIEVVDPSDLIVPPYARRQLNLADRLCQVYRMSPRAFKKLAAKNPTYKNVEKILEKKKPGGQDSLTKGQLEVTQHLIGVTTSGDNSNLIVLWEQYDYATEWTVEKAKELYGEDGAKRIQKDRRVKILYSPDAPEDVVAIHAWREQDEMRPIEGVAPDGTPIQTVEIIEGEDRGWPYIQCRYENRSKFYYDSRGAGQLAMDDQIAASATRNCKHTMMDFYQLPQYSGPGNRNSPQMTFEPGSFLPEGVSRVDPSPVPMNFDFTVDQFRREAGRRVGVAGLYEYSDQVAQTRKIQKTATEVQRESMRGDMVSTASVDRFVSPWIEVFQQLWEDLKRMGIQLPMVMARNFLGMTRVDIYQFKVLIVPAANAKTLSPDLQFVRDTQLWDFCAGKLASMGVPLDPQAAARDIISHVDPTKTRWLADPQKAGPQGQQPVYVQLQALTEAVKQMQQQLGMVQETAVAAAKLADETAEKLEPGREPGM